MSDFHGERPWLKHYGDLPWTAVGDSPPSSIARFYEFCAVRPNTPAILYFDAEITYGELDRLSDAFAVWLQRSGVEPGDRVAIVVNNTPHFIVAVLGAWKAQAAPAPGNPMYRAGELAKIFADCRPKAVVAQHDNAAIIQEALRIAGLESPVLAADPYDFQTEDDLRVLPPRAPVPQGAPDFLETLEEILASGAKSPRALPDPQSLGLVLYTSGTTGPPKGAMLSHQSMAHAGHLARPWTGMDAFSRHFAIAPLFHITGVITHCCAVIDGACSLVLTYRFEPNVAVEQIIRHRPGFTVAAATAFIALLGVPRVNRETFSSLTSVYSGGAPIPPAIVRAFAERTGLVMHPAYGMTETAAGAIMAPWGSDAPIDPESGALAIGIPMTDVDAMVVDDNGQPAPVGVSGELLMRGPGVMMGYLNHPEESAEALRGGWMHSGDVAFMDPNGWFYIVDRKKDQINASGYKVWPREVEEALYEHPAVREAAVVGEPDAYRGETVKAIISLKPGHEVDVEAIMKHCRERLAAYKAPRVVEILPELPKTSTGKISRALLRSSAR